MDIQCMVQGDASSGSTFEAKLAKTPETDEPKVPLGLCRNALRSNITGPPFSGIRVWERNIIELPQQGPQTRTSTSRRQVITKSELRTARTLASKELRKGTLSTSALKRRIGKGAGVLERSEVRWFASCPLRIRPQNTDRPNSVIKKIPQLPETSTHSASVVAEQTTHPDEQTPLSTSYSCISLLSEALRDPHQQSLVCNLSGSDAQLMASYLDIVSREAGALQSNQRRRALYLLCKLVTSAQVFPRYSELSEIGCDMELMDGGGSSDVYKAKQGDRSVCLKIIRMCQKQDIDCILKATGQELAIWAHLSHPYVLPLYGVHLLGGPLPRICFVSPWMEHGNLRNYLVNFPQKPRMPLISDVIDGLNYLHGSRIVHSDLKAENILVSDDGHALIADFGVSSMATSTKLMVVTPQGGTTRWMAPELIIGGGKIQATKSCDIWSFACVCYEVFTHKVPFYQYEDYQLPFALMKQEVPLRQGSGVGYEEIDERIRELLMRCWSYTPQDRPSCETIRDFIKDMGIQDDRPKAVTTTETISACPHATRRPDIEIDYARVRDIFVRMNKRAIGSSSPTEMDSRGQGCDTQINSCWSFTFCGYYVFVFLVMFLVSYFVVFRFYLESNVAVC